jgi:hypothetical protein
VKGVAWDPIGKYIASQVSMRKFNSKEQCLNIFNNNSSPMIRQSKYGVRMIGR